MYERELALIRQYESGNRPLVGWGNTDLSGYPLRPSGFPDWPGKPGPAGVSTAAGLYQITRSTWEPIAARLGITDFSEASQTAVATELLRTRGVQPWAPHNPRLAAALASGEQPEPSISFTAPGGETSEGAAPVGGEASGTFYNRLMGGFFEGLEKTFFVLLGLVLIAVAFWALLKGPLPTIPLPTKLLPKVG
jgi:hypothetical protein